MKKHTAPHAATMKHSASIWDGEVGNSRCIDVVHWEGDITPEELANVASQISPVWEMVDLQLDPAHPLHGNAYHLRRLTDDEYEEAEFFKRRAAFEAKHAGKRVWDEYSLYPDDKLPKPLPIDF